jgi:hypothetical protein
MSFYHGRGLWRMGADGARVETGKVADEVVVKSVLQGG